MPATEAIVRLALPWVAAVLLFATAVNAGAQNCLFTAAPGSIAFSPPGLDPSNAVIRTAFTDVNIRCTGKGVPPPTSWGFVGLWGANPNMNLKHLTLSEFIPYSVGNPPTFVSGSGSNQVWRVTATVLPADYVGASAGDYLDRLTVTVNP